MVDGRDPAWEGHEAARRAALKDGLWAEGVPDDQAEAWIERWTAEADRRGLARDEAWWRLAAEWIARERGAS